MEEKDEIQAWLDEHHWYNGGVGLIVTPTVARHLSEMGITGPYSVQQEVPAGGVTYEYPTPGQ